jgi:hypothetical protein
MDNIDMNNIDMNNIDMNNIDMNNIDMNSIKYRSTMSVNARSNVSSRCQAIPSIAKG